MSKLKFIIAILVVLVFSAAAVWFLWFSGSDGFGYFGFKLPAFLGGGPSAPADSSSGDSAPASGFVRYTNEAYGFTLDYPEGFTPSEYEEGEGTMILFQGSGERRSFQIYITAFDESGPLTVERIRQDLPKIVIENPQNIIIGSRTSGSAEVGLTEGSPTLNGINALIFFIQDESIGKTREIWFVWPPEPYPNGNYLYQITSAAEFDAQLSQIMATWKFK